MFIYKVTNIVNNKMYIGQTSKKIDNPVEARFKRHISDAKSNRLDTHFTKAIRKYGENNFVIEIIDRASSQDELNQKEHYWINYFDSVNNGYNETDSILKSGGNTYLSKTDSEMKAIKQKISDSKKGSKNPNATKVKCKSILTNDEHHFDTINEMRVFSKNQTIIL